MGMTLEHYADVILEKHVNGKEIQTDIKWLLFF